MMPMTSRERVMAALTHCDPDRTPIFEYVLQPPIADRILGHPYAYGQRLDELIREKGWEAALRQQAADIVSLARILNHDLLYVNPNPPPPSESGSTVIPTEAVPVFNDPIEEMAWRVAKAEETFSVPSDDPFLIYRFVREEMTRAGMDLPILAAAYGHGVWTDTALMQTMILEPELAGRHFALATKRSLLRIEKCLQLNIDLIGVGGDFAGNRGPLISPQLYHTFIVPEIQKLSQRVHAGGKFTINASDGNLWPVIDDFLLGCEVDGYIEIDLRAGMDLAELKRQFGARITLVGNLDCANLMSFGTPWEIREHTRECLRKGWGRGGHILCCNNAITESVPYDNYIAIQEAYREFFGL